ncbi:hypothetical protein BCR35DRAFT_301836, partial [Leucosporidium creatinivorum]
GDVAHQLAFDAQSAAQASAERLGLSSFLAPAADEGDDKCPDLVVRCVKDGDVTQVIGDIGEQGFCKEGLKCVQCHSKKNSLECNAKYLKKCAGKCEGWGSPI